jgi:hypothetical protein
MVDEVVQAVPEDEAVPSGWEDVLTEPDEGASAEPVDDVAELRKQIEELQKRIGTDDDVNVVKSQRDKARNEVDQLRPAVEGLQQQFQSIQQQRQTNEYANWEQQWRAHVAAQPDEPSRRLASQQFEVAREKVVLAQQAQIVAQQRASLEQRAQQDGVQSLINKTVQTYAKLAETLGIPARELNLESESKLQASFDEAVAKRQRLNQNPPANIPHVPQRGRQAPAQDLESWFDSKRAQGKYNDIEAVFTAAKQGQGLRPEDILRR